MEILFNTMSTTKFDCDRLFTTEMISVVTGGSLSGHWYSIPGLGTDPPVIFDNTYVSLKHRTLFYNVPLLQINANFRLLKNVLQRAVHQVYNIINETF